MNKVHTGDHVTFTIPKGEKEKLNTDDNAFVTSVRVKYTTYLSANDTIEQEASYALLYGAAVFLALGLIIFKLVKYQPKTIANEGHIHNAGAIVKKHNQETGV